MTQAEATTCGCATITVGSGSTAVGACGCMADQRPTDQTIEELRALRDTIDRRLAALEG
jgi:hypothetical protein